jgi:YggT family protein
MTAVTILFQILDVLIQVTLMVILVQAVMSWLLAFNVISLHNDVVRGIWSSLEKLTDPLYRPIRRIMPDFGALDLSPMVVIVILIILQRILPTIYASIASSM